jgi:hypothetical protein
MYLLPHSKYKTQHSLTHTRIYSKSVSTSLPKKKKIISQKGHMKSYPYQGPITYFPGRLSTWDLSFLQKAQTVYPQKNSKFTFICSMWPVFKVMRTVSVVGVSVFILKNYHSRKSTRAHTSHYHTQDDALYRSQF